MNSNTASKLKELNHQFYQTFALQFSTTRQRLQPGVSHILDDIQPNLDILDLGCGNGRLAAELACRNHQASYTGLDFSQELLAEARRRLTKPMKAVFLAADLFEPGWEASLPASSWDVILAFAVLHHLPGADIRRRVLRSLRCVLAPGGRFIHSEWQFLNSPRLRARIQPWELIGLTPSEVDPGDYLLDWRQGGYTLRYVHLFSVDELALLAIEAGFQVIETFYSDGREGNLGIYQVWEPLNWQS